jgi:hypothetical protein
MKQYAARFDKTSNIVMALVLPPLAVVPLILLVGKFAPGLADWQVIAGISIFMVLLVGITVPLVMKMSPRCLVTLNDDGFVVDFPEKSKFAPGSFEVKSSEIINAKTGVTRAGLYIRLETSVKPQRFNLSQGSGVGDEMRGFAELSVAITQMISGQQMGNRQ